MCPYKSLCRRLHSLNLQPSITIFSPCTAHRRISSPLSVSTLPRRRFPHTGQVVSTCSFTLASLLRRHRTASLAVGRLSPNPCPPKSDSDRVSGATVFMFPRGSPLPMVLSSQGTSIKILSSLPPSWGWFISLALISILRSGFFHHIAFIHNGPSSDISALAPIRSLPASNRVVLCLYFKLTFSWSRTGYP